MTLTDPIALWYPRAKRDLFPDAGRYTAGPYRGVLHTTEGKSYGGARQVYLAHKVPPHFTKGVGFCFQHMPLNRAARALENPPGGTETNRLSAVQIEVVASAEHPDWPDQLIDETADLMEWIEEQTGIRPWAPPFKAYRPGDPPGVSAYGLRNGVRMAASTWAKFNGWCGHQHVPENHHGDPGAIPIGRLLQREEPVPIAPGLVGADRRPTCIVVRPQGDGYWIVAYDGGVFAFGNAPSGELTAIGGGAIERIVSADAWPDGEGLVAMGEDGGVFALGSAVFSGRVEWRPA